MQTETHTTTKTQTMIVDKKPMNIHLILSRSYSVYFFAFIIGLVIDAILALNFDIKLGGQQLSSIGFVVIMVATFLMYWAQTVNKKANYLPDGSKDFTAGPYKYSRNPTQMGLFLLVLGAGFMMNSYIVCFGAILALTFSTLYIIPLEESRHIRKHGEAYLNYMKKVRRLI